MGNKCSEFQEASIATDGKRQDVTEVVEYVCVRFVSFRINYLYK